LVSKARKVTGFIQVCPWFHKDLKSQGVKIARIELSLAMTKPALPSGHCGSIFKGQCVTIDYIAAK
jgi:hypothetical protein